MRDQGLRRPQRVMKLEAESLISQERRASGESKRELLPFPQRLCRLNFDIKRLIAGCHDAALLVERRSGGRDGNAVESKESNCLSLPRSGALRAVRLALSYVFISGGRHLILFGLCAFTGMRRPRERPAGCLASCQALLRTRGQNAIDVVRVRALQIDPASCQSRELTSYNLFRVLYSTPKKSSNKQQTAVPELRAPFLPLRFLCIGFHTRDPAGVTYLNVVRPPSPPAMGGPLVRLAHQLGCRPHVCTYRLSFRQRFQPPAILVAARPEMRTVDYSEAVCALFCRSSWMLKLHFTLR